jgi:integrase
MARKVARKTLWLTQKLTERLIARTKPEPGQTIVCPDHVTPGLQLDISRRSRIWRWRYQEGKERLSEKLGLHPQIDILEARRLVAERQRELREGRSSGIKLSKLVEHYVEYAKEKKRTWQEDEAVLRGHVLEHFGADRRVGQIQKQEVRAFVRKLKKGYRPARANRIYAVCRRMFRWAHGEDLISRDPTMNINQPVESKEEEKRYVTLTDEEIVTLWRETEEGKTPASTRHYIRLLILTGLRPTEVRTLRWEWVQTDRIEIPAEGTKTKRLRHVVPITPMVQSLLDEIENNVGFLFPSESDSDRPMASATAGRWKVRRLGTRYRLHDIRTNIASFAVGRGFDPEVARRILGHRPQGVLGSHYLTQEALLPRVKKALIAWQKHVAHLLKA